MDIIEKKNILKKFPLLSTIEDKDLEALASMVLVQEFHDEDIIIKENDIDTTMYLLIEGVIKWIPSEKTPLRGRKRSSRRGRRLPPRARVGFAPRRSALSAPFSSATGIGSSIAALSDG